jgi:hypothetical protein
MFDRPMLTQLAFKLLTEGEEAARDVARKSNKLTEDLVDALMETRARFAAAMTEIDQVQVVGYLARVLQEPYGIDYNDLLNTLRLVRAGELAAARSFVESLDKDVALVDEILRRQTELMRWQNIHADDKLAGAIPGRTALRAPLQRPRRAHPRRAGRPAGRGAPTGGDHPRPRPAAHRPHRGAARAVAARQGRRSGGWAGCTSSARSGTSRGASTTSCAAAPPARATPARRASSSRWKTT